MLSEFNYIEIKHRRLLICLIKEGAAGAVRSVYTYCTVVRRRCATPPNPPHPTPGTHQKKVGLEKQEITVKKKKQVLQNKMNVKVQLF